MDRCGWTSDVWATRGPRAEGSHSRQRRDGSFRTQFRARRRQWHRSAPRWGTRPICKRGDPIVRFTNEKISEGSIVAIEAKHGAKVAADQLRKESPIKATASLADPSKESAEVQS